MPATAYTILHSQRMLIFQNTPLSFYVVLQIWDNVHSRRHISDEGQNSNCNIYLWLINTLLTQKQASYFLKLTHCSWIFGYPSKCCKSHKFLFSHGCLGDCKMNIGVGRVIKNAARLIKMQSTARNPVLCEFLCTVAWIAYILKTT